MRRANQVIGLPVITSGDSRQIGKVKNIAYADSRAMVVGFLLETSEYDALPFDAIKGIAADTVIVPDEFVLRDHDSVTEIKRAVDSPVKFDDLRVVDPNGDEVGTIEDTFFDEKTGLVAGFQVSRAGQGDILGMGGDSGKTKFFLPFSEISEWSEDQVRVPYDRDTEELYSEGYPQGYDEYGEYTERRAA